jgi:hypothetical protein
MRKLLLFSLCGLALLFVLGIGLLSIFLNQLSDPASSASVKFTASFMEKCVAAAQGASQTQQSANGDTTDNMTELCQCGAENMREDLADAGMSGFFHMILVEGFGAKLQRVMDDCQAIPSAP